MPPEPTLIGVALYVNATPKQVADFLERFWSRVNKDGPIPTNRPELGPCWEWTGYIAPNGYGSPIAVFGGMKRSPHRISYLMHVGPIPEGHETDHLCRNRKCLNPDHLEAVTPRVNQRRSFSCSGVNAHKTHCKHGHPFTPENTYAYANGNRQCRECRRIFGREHDRRRQGRRRRRTGRQAV